MRILCIAEGASVVARVAEMLRAGGWNVQLLSQDEQPLQHCFSSEPCVIVIDAAHSSESVVELCRRVRVCFAKSALVIFTRQYAGPVAIAALEAGADQLVPSSCEADDLLATIRAILRRSPPPDSWPDGSSASMRKLAAPSVTVTNPQIELTRLETRIIRQLGTDPGHVTPVRDLCTRVWGVDRAYERRALYVHIRNIRVKLGPNAWRLQTVRGRGYRLLSAAHGQSGRAGY